MSERVVVFLDWQNVYRRGREAFGADINGVSMEPHTVGQVDPYLLAQRLVSMKPDRDLAGLRIYRGIPTNKENPKGYAANRRQTAAWMNARSLRPDVYLRPLQYLDGMDPREKGIDVQIAIDFVMMAVLGQYDVGILFSVDTDLKPALDAVCSLKNGPVAEVAAWSGAYAAPRRITPSGRSAVWCHWLHKDAFEAVADPRDYSIGQ